MNCKYCSHIVPDESIFCMYCGERLARKKREKKPEPSYPKYRVLADGSLLGQLMVDGKRESVKGKDEAEYKAKIDAIRNHIIEVKKNPDKRIVRDCIRAYIDDRDQIRSPATIDGYERKFKNNLQDLLGLRVEELNKDIIQAAVAKDAKKYAGKTIKEAYSLLRSATGIRIKWRDLVTPSDKPKKKPPVYNSQDLRKLLLALDEIGGEIECAGLLATWMSLRRSEIMGLKWGDLQGGELVIRTARVYNKKHKLVEKDTKNETSERRVPCDSYVLNKLHALPGEHTADGYVFTMSTAGIWKGITTACNLAGIEHGYLHGFRHTNASIMEMLGVPPVYANKRGGWANDHVRQRTYTDIMVEGDLAAADKVDGFFSGLLYQGPPLPPGFVRKQLQNYYSITTGFKKTSNINCFTV